MSLDSINETLSDSRNDKDLYYSEMSEPKTCPTCGGIPKMQNTRYGKRFSCCDLWCWDRGDLVNKDTHEARKLAHSSLDVLWKNKGMDRSEVYSSLAKELGLDKADCHIKLMNAELASRVPFAALKILINYRNN